MMKGEEEKHIVSSLARVLNTDHAVIFRCVQSLEEKALLESEQEVKKGKRFLVPTDFGAIIAFHECGVDYEKWVEKHGDSDARAELETLQGDGGNAQPIALIHLHVKVHRPPLVLTCELVGSAQLLDGVPTALAYPAVVLKPLKRKGYLGVKLAPINQAPYVVILKG